MPALRDLRTLERRDRQLGRDRRARPRPRCRQPAGGPLDARLRDSGCWRGPATAQRAAASGRTLCPALSLPDLLTGGAGAAGNGATGLSRSSIDSLLASVPRYFSQAVITPDRRYGVLAFGIRLMPLAAAGGDPRQMRAGLHPPRGVSAQLAGLPVLAADAGGAARVDGSAAAAALACAGRGGPCCWRLRRGRRRASCRSSRSCSRPAGRRCSSACSGFR